MMGVLFRVLIALALSTAAALAAGTGENRAEVVTMEPGRYSRMLADKIAGLDTVTYLVAAETGQSIAIRFETSNPQSFFDVFAPDGSKLHDGRKGGTAWSAVAPSGGRYAARVMLADRPARRGEQASYRIDFAVTGKPAEGAVAAAPADPAAPTADAAASTAVPPATVTAPAGTEAAPAVAAAQTAAASTGTAPAADAQSAAAAPAAAASEPAVNTSVGEIAKAVAPDADYKGAAKFWAVTGVPPNGTLPVYEQPGVEASRIGQLAHDATGIANLGCRMANGGRWCRVELKGQAKRDGWVAGRYLRETSADAALREPSTDIGVRRLLTITGVIQCSQDGSSKPSSLCETRVQRAGPGLAIVYATLPDGAVRVLNFTGGDVFNTNPDLAMKWSVDGPNYVVKFNDRELLVIPRQVVDGG